MRIVLYSRRGCHLCEHAEELLAFHAPDAVVVDVDAHAEAKARFDLRVPVLEVDERVVLEGRIDEKEMGRALALLRAVRSRD